MRLLRGLLLGLIPPLIGFAADKAVFAALGMPWLLMVAAVVASAAAGGMVSGLTATISSAALVWWYFIPPVQTLGAVQPYHYVSVTVFLAVGFAISLLHERVRQTRASMKGAMRELAESQRFLQGVLDYSPNPIVIKSREGRYVMVSNGFSEIARRPPADVRGCSDAQLFPPPLAKRLHGNDEHALAERVPIVTEESLKTDGLERVFLVTKFPLLNAANEIIALGGIWTDVTERKRKEQEARRVASELRTAQRVAHVGSFRWDLRSGEIEWSEELYRILGLDPSQKKTGLMYLDENSPFLSKETRARVRAAMEKTRADGSPYEMEVEFTRPDGSAAWLTSRGEVERDEAGNIIAITGTSADITPIKNLQQLRDEWTSVVAHDLRQPIATVLMASEVLPEVHPDMTEKGRDLVRRVHLAAQALRRMVDDLLDMSLLEADRLKLERSPVPPTELVQESLDGLAHLEGVERVQISVEKNVPRIFADPVRIKQVLINLLSNAMKYGDPNSRIGVKVQHRAGEVTFAVTNHGRGILPDEMPRLFNRFVRSRENRGSGIAGLGLGLYIARGIMQAHGGKLWAQSTPGQTTTFFASIPAATEQRDAA